MSTAIIKVQVDPDTDHAGTEIARALRAAADYAEQSISIIRYGPNSDWIPETHRVSPNVTIRLP